MRTGGSQIGEAQALAFLARPAPFDLNLYASQPEAAAEIRYFAETPGASALAASMQRYWRSRQLSPL